MVRRATLLGLAVAGVVCVGQEAWAKPKGHCPPGHAKKGWCTPNALPQIRQPQQWDGRYVRRAPREDYYNLGVSRSYVRRAPREDYYDLGVSERYYVRRAPRVEYYDDDLARGYSRSPW